jgi:hypothetical protein
MLSRTFDVLAGHTADLNDGASILPRSRSAEQRLRSKMERLPSVMELSPFLSEARRKAVAA